MTTTSFFSAFATRHTADAGRARQNAWARLQWLASVMDSAVRIPGTSITLGADAVLGLVPGVGNLVTTAVSGYLVHEAWRLGVPRRTLARMIGNVALDSAISAVPVVGNMADVFWKANRKNMAILAEHLGPERFDHEHFGPEHFGHNHPSSPPVLDGEWRRVA
ncbi:DUF4112 domain-containing protein [Azospirillum rugosum]|uniref:DUF4112 domain-containing protein n=2 Tax=Azospirillum rugosum TaxID=416170 RepID=A0ABS4SLJ9_9PROT|nr:hypothetical protein [Azospirillum rugosum]